MNTAHRRGKGLATRALRPAADNRADAHHAAKRQIVTHQNVRGLATPLCVLGVAICIASPAFAEAREAVPWAILAFVFGAAIAVVGARLYLRVWRCPSCGKTLPPSTYTDSSRVVCRSCGNELRL